MVPITNVVSANDVDDYNFNPTTDLQLVRIERLLDRLESRIDFILLKYGHVPEVAEKCEEVLELINSDSLLDLFCDILGEIVEIIIYFQYIIPYVLWVIIFFPPGLILGSIYMVYCKEGQNYPIPELTNL
jgi:hypothetical protein